MQNDGVKFLSVEEAVAIHERLIERFGGGQGTRDRGLLESVLFRPQTGYYTDIAEMAAALFESLLLNHSFVDSKLERGDCSFEKILPWIRDSIESN